VTGVWVASTRLANSDLSPESKYPVYIPTSVDSKLARLLISDVHKSATHANFETVLNQIKSTYWIPRLCSRRGTPSRITSDQATTFKMSSSFWKMAKITSLTDTSATLRSHTGRIIERPINLLIPLEIHSNEEPEVVMTNVANETDVAHPMTTRSR
ncbi:hypothetical protein PFISCL1PPCAC_4548, partial [Pristionchus fissidentatus]